MPGLGTKEPKTKKVTKLYGKVTTPSDAIIQQLKTPVLTRKDTKRRVGGILSEDGKKLALSNEYDT